MAIRNKDGSEYNYSYPNPVRAEQNIWNSGEKCLMHNKFGNLTIQEMENKPRPEPIIVERSVGPQIVHTDANEEVEMFEAPTNKIEAWCLPAYSQEYVDSLYGEKYNRIKYGNKFKFEMLIENQSDFGISFWTNTKTVTEGSVVFPKNKDKRWWRVTRTQQEDDLYLLTGVIADYHPSFA